jgi:hypothetical protein
MTTGGIDVGQRGWPEIRRFESDVDAEDVAAWWNRAGFRRDQFAAQGRKLAGLVFEGDWCRRRVVNLHFVEERRGEWHSSVDFEVPSQLDHLELCDAGRHRRWLPLAMYRKHLLPITHMQARDEEDRIVPTASSAVSAQLAFAILMGTAALTSLDLSLAAPLLWRIACPNSVASDEALAELLRRNWPAANIGGLAAHREEFLLYLRCLAGSALVVYELPRDQAGEQRVLNLYSDGPVRVSRRFWEMTGWRPLTVAPRVVFGGNAVSYDVEIAPPQQILVADSRLIFSYFQPPQVQATGYPLEPPTERTPLTAGERLWRWWIAGSLHRPRKHGPEEPLTVSIREQSMKRRWDQVEGSAEPNTAHVRVRGSRLPRISQGRDIYAIFQFYPQYVGQLLQFLFVAGINVAFLAIVTRSVDDPAMKPLLAQHPDILLIAVLAVVGIGGGITVVPREHVLTTFVLKPWRQYVVVILFLTLAGSALVLVYGRHWSPPGTTWSVPAWTHELLRGATSLAALTWLVLAAITWRVRKAETRGTRCWRRIGLRFRLAQYPCGKALDERALGAVPGDQKARQRAVIESLYVDQYLRDDSQRVLLNRGIPVSIRHEPPERGF